MTASASRCVDRAAVGPATIGQRAVGLGGGAGLLAGAGLGAAVTKTLGGALAAALLGWTIGVGVGLVDGLVLAAAVRLTRSRPLVAIVVAAASTGCGDAVISTAWPSAWAYGPWTPPAGWLAWTVLGLTAAGGGLVMPHAATPGRRTAVTRRRAADTIVRGIVAGLFIGGSIGGLVGLFLGFAYWPTAPVAVVEGVLIGGLPTGLFGCLAGTAYVLARPRRLAEPLRR